MRKDSWFLIGLLAFLVIGSLIDTGTTDGYFIALTTVFFVFCIAYVELCDRL
jgi:hypothetical protein